MCLDATLPVSAARRQHTRAGKAPSQAFKYCSLAAADAGYPLRTSRVRYLVVAYYPKAAELAARYEIPLIEVNRDHVLAPTR